MASPWAISHLAAVSSVSFRSLARVRYHALSMFSFWSFWPQTMFGDLWVHPGAAWGAF